VSSDDLLKFAIPAIILLMALGSRLVKGMQRSGQAAAPRSAAPAAAASPSVPQQRVAAMLAEMQRRGITPPPALQAIAAMEGVPAAPPAAPQQPRYARGERRPEQVRSAPPEIRAPVFPAPGALDPAAMARAGSTRRMVVDAFSDPEHARNAVILAEILGSPAALRSTTSRPWAAL
jgi:hypothetical protein